MDTVNSRYFLKLDYSVPHKSVYEASFPVVQHLCDHGIDFVSRIVRTKRGQLCTYFDSAVLGVFEWMDGDIVETEDTKIPEYEMLAKVYTVPYGGLTIPRESFSDLKAVIFMDRYSQMQSSPVSEAGAGILEILRQNHSKIVARAKRLKEFSYRCQGDRSRFFITHGDAGGNLMMNKGRPCITDWDEVMAAPPERDAWVMCCQDWAREAFQKALHERGIIYALQPERLAYYCYHMFFTYLNAFLDGFTRAEPAQEIREYFHGWIEDRIQFADSIL